MVSSDFPFAVFRSVAEPFPDEAWRGVFRRYWPAYRSWYLSRGGDQGVDLSTAERALRRHMPELVPVYERLVELADGDALAARFLTLWRPPLFLSGCSQAVWSPRDRSSHPGLVRNYDLAPDMFEALIVDSAWRGRRVIASNECLWGVDDGINEDGLAVSLTYGGSRATGEGFGIPLILRYLLETCTTAGEAELALRRVPSHMAYNVAVVDAAGDHRTVFLHPHRATEVSRRRSSTNHQRRVEWPEHARRTRSVERERFLAERLERGSGGGLSSLDSVVDLFLGPDLYHREWTRCFGTLYTVAYDCVAGAACFSWPGTAWKQSFERFEEGSRKITYGAPDRSTNAAAREAVGARSDNDGPAWSDDWLPPVLEAIEPHLLTALRTACHSASPRMVEMLERLALEARTRARSSRPSFENGD